MENRIRKHIEGIFAGAPETAKARDLREEMIINVIERYHDHLASGMSEEDAYRAAITGIGDVSNLIDSLRREADAGTAAGAGSAQTPPRQNYAPAPPANPAPQRKGLSTGAIVAIVICSTILLLTLVSGILAANIVGKLFSGDGFLSNIIGMATDGSGNSVNPGNFTFEDDEGFDNAYAETGSYSVPADGISSIEVDWVAGGVTIQPAPAGTNDISFSETSYGTVSSEYALRYKVSGDKLIIRYCDSEIWRGIDWSDLFNSVTTPQKQLTLYIPASLLNGALGKLSVNGVSSSLTVSDLSLAGASLIAVSGSIKVRDSSFSALNVESVSGSITVSDCTGESINVGNVSGGSDVDGTFNRFELNSVSGSINATVAAAANGVRADTVSGNITLRLNGISGFTAHVDTVSGQFSSGGLPVSIQNGEYVYGDGSVEFNLETVSGSINVR